MADYQKDTREAVQQMAYRLEADTLVTARDMAVTVAQAGGAVELSRLYLAMSEVLSEMKDDFGRMALLVLDRNFSGMTPGQCYDELEWLDECAINGETSETTPAPVKGGEA